MTIWQSIHFSDFNGFRKLFTHVTNKDNILNIAFMLYKT